VRPGQGGHEAGGLEPRELLGGRARAVVDVIDGRDHVGVVERHDDVADDDAAPGREHVRDARDTQSASLTGTGQVGLAGAVEVVDAERGDDEVEGAAGQRVLQARDTQVGAGQGVAGDGEHRRAGVDPDEVPARVRGQDTPGGLAGPRPELEDAPRRRPAARRLRDLVLQALEGRHLGRHELPVGGGVEVELAHARQATRMRPSRALLAGLVGAQVLYPRVPPRRQVAATRGIVGLMLATSVAEAIEARGARRGAALCASAAAVGFAAEVAGVASGRPFGHYTYSGKLGPRVAGVPLLAAAAWTMMARPAWVVAGLTTRRRATRVPVAAAALAAWDVFLDPRMVREGYWSWPGTQSASRTGTGGGWRFEDVPASNFAGWLGVAGAIFAVWAVLDPDDDPVRDGDGALALYTWTWIGETVANVAFWGRPRVALAGGAAMGGPALAALRARLGP
jgi:uncharacterized membrane protein